MIERSSAASEGGHDGAMAAGLGCDPGERGVEGLDDPVGEERPPRLVVDHPELRRLRNVVLVQERHSGSGELDIRGSPPRSAEEPRSLAPLLPVW